MKVNDIITEIKLIIKFPIKNVIGKNAKLK